MLGKDYNYPAILIELPDYTKPSFNNESITWQQAPFLGTMRNEEFSVSFVTSEKTGFDFIVYYSTQKSAILNAILSIFRTLFVCIVLSAASFYFINDANKLVLNPIERMLEKVRLI